MLRASAAQYCSYYSPQRVSYYSPQHKQRVSQLTNFRVLQEVSSTFCRKLQRGSCALAKCEGVINRSILNDPACFIHFFVEHFLAFPL